MIEPLNPAPLVPKTKLIRGFFIGLMAGLILPYVLAGLSLFLNFLFHAMF